MTQNKRIAITGGIGSGKSTFSEILKKKGYGVISADEIYAEICGETRYIGELSRLFPECVKGGILDRKALSARVFSDAAALAQLNSIAHPLIMDRLLSRMKEKGILFAEIPLLFENGFERFFDDVVYIRRGIDERISSVMERDGMSEREVVARIRMQFNGENLTERDCVIVDNSDDLEALEKEAERVISLLALK